MTLYFQKKPQRDFVFHFFFNLYYSLFILFFLLFIFFLQHADVHATACWRIGSYAPARVIVIALVVSKHILQSTVFLSKFLQGIECDLLEATKECETVIELLRLDESVWDELYQSALDLSEPFDIVENMRKTDYQSQSPCRHAKTVSWVLS
jgi:hypothetical protein